MVDATVGHELLNFMNAIPTRANQDAPKDQDKKIALATGHAIYYYYRVMPFGPEECRSHFPANGQRGLQRAN